MQTQHTALHFWPTQQCVSFNLLSYFQIFFSIQVSPSVFRNHSLYFYSLEDLPEKFIMNAYQNLKLIHSFTTFPEK